MNAWPKLSLNELCSLITDGKHGDCRDEEGSGYYFLSVKDVLGGRLVYDNARQISEPDFLETHRRTSLAPGDILFTNTGTIGRMAIAADDPKTYRTTFQKSVAILKPKKEIILPKFFYYLLQFDNARLSEFAAGTTQKNLLLKDFRNFAVQVPPLPEQRAIASILGSLDDKIELNRRMNETLEALAQTLFKSWFIDPTRNGLPKGWREGTLGEITGLLGGYAFKSKDWIEAGVPVVKIGSVKPGVVDLNEVSFVSEEIAEEAKRFRLASGDLLVGMTGYVGEVGLVPPTETPPLLNQRVGKFILKRPGTSALGHLYCFTRRPEFKSAVESKSHGTAQANVSAEGILSIPLTIPSESVRDAFNRVCEPMLNRILANHAESRILGALRDALIPKLLSGEIRLQF